MAFCRYHPDRAGVGICMRCRAVICDACRTRVDGVNHCHACLAALARPEPKPVADRGGTGAAALLSVGAGGVLLFCLGWWLQGRLAP